MIVTEINCVSDGEEVLVGWARNEQEASLQIQMHCQDFDCATPDMRFTQVDKDEQYLLTGADMTEMRGFLHVDS